MNKNFETYRPPNFGTLSNYLFVDNPEELIQFLKNCFFAEEKNRSMDETKTIVYNVILEMGTSSLMISQASEKFPAMPTSFYFFVSDCDFMYQRALEFNAISIMPPFDAPYGDRQAGVKDCAGNIWWISTRMVKEPYVD